MVLLLNYHHLIHVILSTDVMQLTFTLKMTTAQVVETSVNVNNNSPIFRTAFTQMIIPG